LINRKPNIGIVGGGIGGVAAAAALRQVGIDAVVYERSSQLGEVGAGMMLWPNATRVLQRMELLPDILERCGSSTHFLVPRLQRTRHIQHRSRLMGAIGQWENRGFVAGRRVVTGLRPASLFEYNLRRVYSYEI
jgi:2-polyprenyl-6-methoxyphenol hydroxylase-like FAD-dependent oxidoreductase